MRIKCRAMGSISIHVGLLIRESGRIISIMGLECMSLPMGPYMKDSGRIILCMVLACILMCRVESGRASSEMANFKINVRKNLSKRGKSS
jgi:hypothetical protein